MKTISITLATTLCCMSQLHSVLSSDFPTTSSKTEGVELIKKTLITRTDVSELASISLNIRRMFQECSYDSAIKGDYTKVNEVYEAKHYSKYSLKDLATNPKFQNVGLTFAYQMYGLAGGETGTAGTTGTTDSEATGPTSSTKSTSNFDRMKNKTPFTNFADVYIQSLLQHDNKHHHDNNNGASTKCEQAATATIWHILFMHSQYELWSAMEDCRIYSDPSYNNEVAGINPDHNAKADEFIAYWVGSLMGGAGDNGYHNNIASTHGYSPFSLANKISSHFARVELDGVAYSNHDILHGYESLSALLSNDRSCDADMAPSTLKSMWIINNQITRSMMIPLIQYFIKSMIDDDKGMVQIYAAMLVPQLTQCRYSNYEYLSNELLDHSFDKKNIHTIMKHLQESYGCLNIKCVDIGVPYGTNAYHDSHLSCKDEDYKYTNLAGYQTTEDVREESKIDLDIHQMNILMSFDNDNYWLLAKHIYLYGKNSIDYKSKNDDDDSTEVEIRSLHSLATSYKREGTMFFDSMLASNYDEPFNADSIITNILNNKSHQSESREVKAAIIYNVILTQVIYVHILVEMKDAVDHCHNLSEGRAMSNANPYRLNTHSTKAWDQVAAYIIGSLEGSRIGGSIDSSDGTFIWSLANKRAAEFDRRNDNGYAIVNDAVLDGLLSGKGQLMHMNCNFMDRTSKIIAYLLLIPMIQSVIKYAISNQYLEWNKEDDVDVELGQIYARFLYPIYSEFSEASAKTLQNNMIPKFDYLVTDGPQAVADAYLDVAKEIGIQCEYIGKSSEVDGCLNYVPTLKEGARSDASTNGKTWKTGVTTAVSLGVFLFLL